LVHEAFPHAWGASSVRPTEHRSGWVASETLRCACTCHVRFSRTIRRPLGGWRLKTSQFPVLPRHAPTLRGWGLKKDKADPWHCLHEGVCGFHGQESEGVHCPKWRAHRALGWSWWWEPTPKECRFVHACMHGWHPATPKQLPATPLDKRTLYMHFTPCGACMHPCGWTGACVPTTTQVPKGA
jgi:hypothetical protein